MYIAIKTVAGNGTDQHAYVSASVVLEAGPLFPTPFMVKDGPGILNVAEDVIHSLADEVQPLLTIKPHYLSPAGQALIDEAVPFLNVALPGWTETEKA